MTQQFAVTVELIRVFLATGSLIQYEMSLNDFEQKLLAERKAA